jgi:protein involved in polysaccharide export with SLBB domain
MAVYELYVPRFYRPGVIPVPDRRVYFVGGQVRSPCRQMYLGATTVTKAIQSASDFTDFAAKRRVELTRADGQKLVIDCERAARNPALDLPVYPGDKIVVPQRHLWDSFR